MIVKEKYSDRELDRVAFAMLEVLGKRVRKGRALPDLHTIAKYVEIRDCLHPAAKAVGLHRLLGYCDRHLGGLGYNIAKEKERALELARETRNDLTRIDSEDIGLALAG